jgi:hypothetical protein
VANKKEVMVMNYLFYLDDLEIEEPMGFDTLELSIKRDDTYHGMTFEAATSPLQFYKAAFDYLKNKYETEGVKANVTFKAYSTCGNYDYEEILSGRLNFGKYKESCGDQCMISLPWEQDSCDIVLKSRFDQKVDIDKATGADNFTPLPEYNALGIETELPAHNLKTGTEGYVADEGDAIDLSIFAEAFAKSFVRPSYGRHIDQSLNVSQLDPAVFAASNNGVNDSVLSPIVLLDPVNEECYDGNFDYEVRLKGSFDIQYIKEGDPTPVTSVFRFMGAIGKGEFNANQNPEGATFPPVITSLGYQSIDPGPDINHWVGTFDISFSGTTAMATGDGFYAFLTWEPTGPFNGVTMIGNITFDPETYVKVQGIRSCPATTADLYMIHETLSRATEAVTNRCVRVKSSYYGRTDSEPFSFDADGCGGLRSVTSGLKIRKAPEDKFFASVKDLIDGLNAIDNIGMAVENDPDITDAELLIIEDVDYFYQDIEILRHDAVPKADTDVEETRHYSKINVGYKKWEVEEVNGLDEFNSNRQYNTSIDTVNSTLEITSGLVAGSYPIEITRQQSFADTGAADTKYDNETFIICMQRSDYPVYDQLMVEQGNVTNAANIFSPNTIYNYRISPIRNLMRWYKSIAPSYVNISDSANKLFFTAGTGNLIASGMMTDPTCRLESMELQENQNLFVTHFANPDDYTPLWMNEIKTYDYSISLADYRAIKATPYGYISVQCGSGDYIKYWIKEIKYRLNEGTGTFILRRKYGV